MSALKVLQSNHFRQHTINLGEDYQLNCILQRRQSTAGRQSQVSFVSHFVIFRTKRDAICLDNVP